MPPIIIVQNELPPVGEFVLRLAELTTVEGKYGEQLRYKFEIAQTGEYAGRVLYAYATPSGNPSSKCVRWASALLGRPLEAGEQLNLESLQGRLARAIVLVKQASDGREVSAIQELLPLKRPGKPTPPAEPEDPFA